MEIARHKNIQLVSSKFEVIYGLAGAIYRDSLANNWIIVELRFLMPTSKICSSSRLHLFIPRL